MKDLLKKLTIEEKLGQLTMIPPFFYIKDLKKEVFGALTDMKLSEEGVFQTGSVLGIQNHDEMNLVQSKYLEKSRHKIPLIFMGDVIHGTTTIMPTPLAQASSFNPSLVRKGAQASAKEALKKGLQVTFSPMSDLSRDPRWGRVVESYGEDPYLNYILSKETVKGYKSEGLLSCVKHFAAYGLSEAGQDYNTVDLSRLNLFEYYLEGYRGAIEAGADMVMTSFNTFEYVPATTNEYLLRDVLRKHLKFKGVTISDYDSLLQTIYHRTSSCDCDAAIKGIKAGLDIEMASSSYMRCLKEAANKDPEILKLIDEAVLRVLELKKKAKLFDDPYRSEHLLIDASHAKEAAYKLAKESIVLLKNESLPLNKKTKVSLLGKYATEKHVLGPWSWHGDPKDTDELAKHIKAEYMNDSESFFDYDLAKIKQTEHIILAIGELYHESGEAHSKADINLSSHYIELLENLSKLNIPITVVLYTGRPQVLTNALPYINNLLVHFHLGSMTSKVVSDTIYGINNPSGRLPMTFPRHQGQIPIYYNRLSTGRPYSETNPYVLKYLDVSNEPLFDFGYGLSYSKFTYKNLELSNSVATLNNLPTVKVTVTNESDVTGKTTILLYIKDEFASVARPVKELKQFKKISLKPHESKVVEFKLTKKDLSFYNQKLKKIVEPGEFTIFIENLEQKFTLK
ncbi:MAG TPA: beta-glucosidase [Acholeplasmataceae bacterium]|jgi:beta-glucosidase|nr:beta-glucosidase [Acholeplasmataceae bacterium]